LRKLPARTLPVVMPLILSLKMTFVVSGIATLKSLGLVDGFVAKWMGAWGLSWAVAFPVLLVMMPLVRRIVGLIVETPGLPPRS
jgi:hypothetical protein